MSQSWALRSLLGRGTSSWLKATSEPMYRPLTHHTAHAQRWLCCVLISEGLKWSWQSSIYKVIWAHRIQSLLFFWWCLDFVPRKSLFASTPFICCHFLHSSIHYSHATRFSVFFSFYTWGRARKDYLHKLFYTVLERSTSSWQARRIMFTEIMFAHFWHQLQHVQPFSCQSWIDTQQMITQYVSIFTTVFDCGEGQVMTGVSQERLVLRIQWQYLRKG